jgi:hypothetical protein
LSRDVSCSRYSRTSWFRLFPIERAARRAPLDKPLVNRSVRASARSAAGGAAPWARSLPAPIRLARFPLDRCLRPAGYSVPAWLRDRSARR